MSCVPCAVCLDACTVSVVRAHCGVSESALSLSLSLSLSLFLPHLSFLSDPSSALMIASLMCIICYLLCVCHRAVPHHYTTLISLVRNTALHNSTSCWQSGDRQHQLYLFIRHIKAVFGNCRMHAHPYNTCHFSCMSQTSTRAISEV